MSTLSSVQYLCCVAVCVPRWHAYDLTILKTEAFLKYAVQHVYLMRDAKVVGFPTKEEYTDLGALRTNST